MSDQYQPVGAISSIIHHQPAAPHQTSVVVQDHVGAHEQTDMSNTTPEKPLEQVNLGAQKQMRLLHRIGLLAM